MSIEFSPDIKKKIIYLDQFVLDFFVKSDHPDFQNKLSTSDRDWWRGLLIQLDKLVDMQLVACPYSPIHEDESLTAKQSFPLLERMYNHLSQGKEFMHYEWIQREQIAKCFESWLRGDISVPKEEFMPPKMQGLPAGIHEWSHFNTVFSQSQTEEKMIEISRRRDAAASEFSRMWSVWHVGQNLSPNEYEQAQLRSIVRSPLTLYEEWMNTNQVFPPSMAQLITYMRRRILDHGATDHEAEQKIQDFFNSDLALAAPFAQIQARMLRQFYVRVKEGRASNQPPSRGMMNDIHAISTYVPFCNAAFIDRECYGLLTEKGGSEVLEGYSVRLFCRQRNGQEFVDYLKKIEADCPGWHKVTGKEKYGEDWPRPFASPFLKE